jgi:DNA-binding transcriptional LysR family regulator
MEMRRLEAFCKVVELKSFTKAAEALLLSQPTISEHIRILEDLLNEKLLDRLGREVLPTPAGRILYQYARNIVQLKDEVVQALEQFKGNLSGRLIIGASTIPGTYILPNLVGSFKKAFPATQITLKISDTAEITEDVVENRIELGFIGSKSQDRRINSEEIAKDELVLAVHPHHPWAEKGKINIKELIGEPFIMRERGSGTRSVMAQLLEKHGLDVADLNAVAEMGSTEAVRQGIKAGIGVSILSKHAIKDDIAYKAMVAVEIDEISFARSIYMIQRKNKQISPLCSAFIEHIAGQKE